MNAAFLFDSLMKLSLEPVKAKLVIAESEFILKSGMRYFSILCREAVGYNRLDLFFIWLFYLILDLLGQRTVRQSADDDDDDELLLWYG